MPFCVLAATPQDINRDLTILSRFTTSIRLSGIAQCPDATRQILSFAQARNMKVFLGLSITQNTNANEAVSFKALVLCSRTHAGYNLPANPPACTYHAIQCCCLASTCACVRISAH